MKIKLWTEMHGLCVDGDKWQTMKSAVCCLIRLAPQWNIYLVVSRSQTLAGRVCDSLATRDHLPSMIHNYAAWSNSIFIAIDIFIVNEYIFNSNPLVNGTVGQYKSWELSYLLCFYTAPLNHSFVVLGSEIFGRLDFVFGPIKITITLN